MSIRKRLLEAHRVGKFLEIALEARSNGDRNHVTEMLIALHNEGTIDIIGEFKSLRNNQGAGPDFFLARNLLENCLPHLNAPLLNVMECVARLVEEAGQDLAAHTIFQSFTDYCAADVSRPSEGLTLIEKSPELWANFVCSIIGAGTRLNMDRFFKEAIALTSHQEIEIRRNAIFSLGRIQFKKESELPQIALKRLANLADQESDDLLLGNVVKSVNCICKHDKSLEKQAVKVIETALEKGRDYSLHAASEEFGFRNEELTAPMRLVIINNLLRINPGNKGTVDNIDYGLADLIKGDSQDQAVEFLENLLLAHPRDLSLKSFDSVINQVLSSGTRILDKLLTRWFLRGDRVLCDGIRIILDRVHGKGLRLKVDPVELTSSDPIFLMFLARKAIGYLFFNPKTAASITISLMQQTDNPDAVKDLAFLLFDPLLLNYSASVGEYLEECVSDEAGQTREAIQTVLDDLEQYFQELKAIGNVPEMHPSQAQREAYSRHFNQLMTGSYKEAMKESLFNQIFSKSVLLYGQKSISYILNGLGEAKRMEIPLQSHGTEIEFPRREHIDPFGLDYMLRQFRVERLVRHETHS